MDLIKLKYFYNLDLLLQLSKLIPDKIQIKADAPILNQFIYNQNSPPNTISGDVLNSSA